MRLLLALFAFVALALAPLGMPAEARAMDDHCTEMAGMEHHGAKPDPSAPQPSKSCCTAMPAALPEADAALPMPMLHAPADQGADLAGRPSPRGRSPAAAGLIRFHQPACRVAGQRYG
ncbi:hypothetical protein [Sphingomonas sp. LHG3443-2]|uniref:hypothetical protein n=1 Tax=Sphingomonas sp. LHG3443-2 TaxID=2804639 RepID=UPI003CEB337C